MFISVRLARPRFRLGLVGLAALLLAGNLVLSLTLVSTASAATITGTWTPKGSMNVARQYHTATLLPNGKVLVAGGQDSNGSLASAELYDPSTGTWSLTGSMHVARYLHTAILLTNGQVLVAGGESGSSVATASAELFSPCSGNLLILCG